MRGDTRNECVSVRGNDGAHGLTSRGCKAHGLVELRSPPGTRPRRDAGVWVGGDVSMVKRVRIGSDRCVSSITM